MKFFRILDRILLHAYVLAALGIGLVFLVDTVAYNHAAFAMLKAQAAALTVIARGLSGT
jgi:hypothetical protein